MSSELHTRVIIPKDENGYVGRECPKCEKYFKIKPGTGLDIEYCICPYCEYKADSEEFVTKDQLDYATSIALRKFSDEIFRMVKKTFAPLERDTRNSFIQIKVHSKKSYIPIQYYKEKDLETDVVCDNCTCNFAIYGVFASCPDCKRLTTMSIFYKSIETTKKKINLIDNQKIKDRELLAHLLSDIVNSGVASFDSLGKRLQNEFPNIFPQKPRNLFQNISYLNDILKENLFSIESLVGKTKYQRVHYLFQVRHLWEHNFGEIDKDFISKTGIDSSMIGKPVILNISEVKKFIHDIETIGKQIREKIS